MFAPRTVTRLIFGPTTMLYVATDDDGTFHEYHSYKVATRFHPDYAVNPDPDFRHEEYVTANPASVYAPRRPTD